MNPLTACDRKRLSMLDRCRRGHDGLFYIHIIEGQKGHTYNQHMLARTHEQFILISAKEIISKIQIDVNYNQKQNLCNFILVEPSQQRLPDYSKYFV